MMDKKLIGGTAEDLELLVLELSEIKEILREASQQIRRIERRVTAALPKSESTTRHGRSSRSVFVFSEHAARELVEELKERVRSGEQIETSLRKFTVKDELRAIARVLGMTNTKLPPKDDLIRRISTRLRQSSLISSGIDAESKTVASASVSPSHQTR